MVSTSGNSGIYQQTPPSKPDKLHVAQRAGSLFKSLTIVSTSGSSGICASLNQKLIIDNT